MSATTTITIGRHTRERLSKVTFEGRATRTADEAVAALIDEHEARQFWDALEAIDPDDYGTQARADGTWPGENDYAVEEGLLAAQEETADDPRTHVTDGRA